MAIGTTIDGLNAVTSLTAQDEVPVWDAEASGEPTKKITAQNMAASVKTLGSLVNTMEMNNALAGKQNILTFDTTQTTGSTNPVTSGGIADAISQSTASKANNVTQTTSIWVITAGYNTGSGNYFDFFLPLNVDMNKTYAVTLSEVAIQYSNLKLSSYFGTCTVMGKQVNGLRCEIRFTQTQTSNIPGTLVCYAAISVT